MVRKSLTAVLLVAACWGAGCASDGAGQSEAPSGSPARVMAASAPVNTTCPFSGKALPAEAPRASYKGQVVAFCCKGCEAKWNDMAAAEKDRILADALAAAR